MSADKHVILSGGARAKNIVWQVAGAVNLGAKAHVEGIVLTKTSVELGNGASVDGRLLAQTAIALSAARITAPAP